MPRLLPRWMFRRIRPICSWWRQIFLLWRLNSQTFGAGRSAFSFLLPQNGPTHNVDPVVESYGCNGSFWHSLTGQRRLPIPQVFKIDLRKAYNQVLISCVAEEVFGCGRRFIEVTAKRECLFKATGYRWTTQFLRDISRQFIDEFAGISRSIDGIIHYSEGHSCSWGVEAGINQKESPTDHASRCVGWFWERYRESQHPDGEYHQ